MFNGKVALVTAATSGIGRATALPFAREAILAGRSVQFVAATTVVAQLAKGHSEGRLEERLAHFAKPKLFFDADDLIHEFGEGAGQEAARRAAGSISPASSKRLRDSRLPSSIPRNS